MPVPALVEDVVLPPAPVPVEVLDVAEELDELDALDVAEELDELDELDDDALDDVTPEEVEAAIWAWQFALSLTPDLGQQMSELAPITCVQTRSVPQSSLPSWVADVSRLQRWPSACRPQPGAVRKSGTATANAAARTARVA